MLCTGLPPTDTKRIVRLDAATVARAQRIDPLRHQQPVRLHPPDPIRGGGIPMLLLEVDPRENHRGHGQQTEDNRGKAYLSFLGHGRSRRWPRVF